MQSNSGSERKRWHVFSLLWKINTKYKCLHKYKHDHIHMYRTCFIVGLSNGKERGGRGKESKQYLSKFVASV
jgi:hypothetical protein